MDMSALERFHPEIRRWFGTAFGTPTDVQEQSWPRIAAGEHLLITAPTGSGKTLTAFLWAINAFANGVSEPEATRVLYVSPLKALNNDIRANLVEPIVAIRACFEANGAAFPNLRVQTRSGDTEAGERTRMLRRPPELLITTPESLTLLLTTVRGRQALSTVETVILDEIHSVVENRRGVQLMTGLERLADIAGEFQRVALSATVRPLEAVADYVGGRDANGAPRPVGIVRSQSAKAIDFRVLFPEAARVAADNGQKIWEPLSDSFRDVIAANRSTLFFTNSRRLAEKITFKLNADEMAPVAYAHHGSLAREIRTEVESRLKDGDLKAIVATNSLELGIDIGDLDEVVLIQSPPSIASALQRVGRAGHRVGETSRGTLFPTFAQDFLEAAVVAKAVGERDIEPLRPLHGPLDVLTQTIVSCAVSEEWATDDLYRTLTRAAPYWDLPREHFDLVVEMLAGRYAGTRIRDLKPRLAFDRVRQTVKARKGAALALYTSGGTIPDRGYFTLRHADSGAVIGELDEEFVWEASVGQNFTLGTQHWLIHRITHNDVLVKNAPPKASAPPFWRGEVFNRNFYFSKRIGEFLETANELLKCHEEAAFHANLNDLGFNDVAAEELIGFLKAQREVTGRDLPHANHLLVEHVRSGPGGYAGPDRKQQIVLHTLWGGRVNRPLALALESAWRERFASMADAYADNNVIVVQVGASGGDTRAEPPRRGAFSGGARGDPPRMKDAVDPALLLSLVTPANFEALLRQSLEGSGFFGARFRECAGRSLLLTKRRFKERMPLWMTRLQAKKLMTSAKPFADFPVLLETWRTCLRDEFDLDAAGDLLERLAAGELAWSVANTAVPSPFAASIAFNQISRYMYADDTPEQGERSALSDDLIRQAVFDRSLRPAIEAAAIADFETRVQRTRDGYVPDGDDELREWVKERVAIAEQDWFAEVPVPDGLNRWVFRGRTFLVHPEIVVGEDPLRQAGEMLQFFGPRTAEELAGILPFDDSEALVRELVDAKVVVQGPLVAGTDADYFCDAENLETLIRFQRAAARPVFEPRPATELSPFLARWHVFGAEPSRERFLDAADRLRGYPAPVGFWLDEAFPPRLSGIALDSLEAAASHDGLAWRGMGRETAAVGFGEDFDLLAPAAGNGDADEDVAALFKDPDARYTFSQLLDESGQDADAFNAAFWQAVWGGRIAADGFQPLAAGRSRRYQLHDATATQSPRDSALRNRQADGTPSARLRDATAAQSPRDSALRNRQADSALSARRGRRRASAHSRAKARGVALGWPGTWYRVSAGRSWADALEQLETGKERCRMLLERYGILTREHANREGGLCRWAAVFPALRIMELAGEVVAGLFFKDFSGPQFALPQAVRQLERLQKAGASFWINALDPASPCGLGLPELPQRRLANHLGWFEGTLAIVSENHGRRLTIHLHPDDPGLDALLPYLAALCRTRRRMDTETVNGQPLGTSPYLPALSRHLNAVADHKGVYFQAQGA